MPPSDWKAPDLSQLPTDWNRCGRIAIDTECKDPDLRAKGIGVRRPDSYAVGFSVAFEDGPKFYLPTRHAGGGNLDPNQVNAYLRDNARTYKGIVAGANLQYEIDYWAEEGITFPEIKFFRDVQIAEPLLDELKLEYNLDSILKTHLGISKNETLLTKAGRAFGAVTQADIKKLIWAMPASHVGPYAEDDSALCLPALRVQEKLIDEQNLWQVWDLESRVLPVCVKMRRRGVLVDLDRLDQVEQWSIRKEAQALNHIHKMTGVKLSVGDTMKAELCARVFRAIGIEPPETSKGAPSITKEWLDVIDHPAATLFRWARQMAQLRSTFVNAVRAAAIPEQGYGSRNLARLHCTFNQLRADKDDESGTKGTITARLSCDHLNLQQQPGASNPNVGPVWRTVYVPEDGAIWASKDYSQQEPIWLIHWSILAGVKRIGEAAHKAALEFAERYNSGKKIDFYDTAKDAAGIKRKPAKIVTLARIYGRGGASTCKQLSLPTEWIEETWRGVKRRREVAGEEGQRIISTFDRAVPFASAMNKADTNQARQCGFIRTWSERRLHFEKDPDGNYMEMHKALNKRIQGSAADQTKVAMVELDREGYHIQVQVHDEINSSVGSIEEGRRAKKIMETCIEMKVPSRVDLEMGPSWGEAVGVD